MDGGEVQNVKATNCKSYKPLSVKRIIDYKKLPQNTPLFTGNSYPEGDYCLDLKCSLEVNFKLTWIFKAFWCWNTIQTASCSKKTSSRNCQLVDRMANATGTHVWPLFVLVGGVPMVTINHVSRENMCRNNIPQTRTNNYYYGYIAYR